MRAQANDTTPDAERVLIQLLRRATPAPKLALLLEANRTVRTLALAACANVIPTTPLRNSKGVWQTSGSARN